MFDVRKPSQGNYHLQQGFRPTGNLTVDESGTESASESVQMVVVLKIVIKNLLQFLFGVGFLVEDEKRAFILLPTINVQ